MAIWLSQAIKDGMANLIKAGADAGGAPGYLELYTGTPPAALGAITDQIKLGTLPLSYPCGSVAGGVLTFGSITEDSEADATGTAAWGRLYSSTGVVVGDFDVAGMENATTEFLRLSTTSITLGELLAVSEMAISIGA